MFTGGEDVATFTPTGQEDEEASQQETDYVNHVIFNENPGWLTFTSAFKDALQAKTGVFKWWWEEGDEEEEAFEGKSAEEFELAQQSGEVVSAEMVEVEGQEPAYNFVLKRRAEGRVVVDTVAPEDITVAKDTVWLPEVHLLRHPLASSCSRPDQRRHRRRFGQEAALLQHRARQRGAAGS
ncbi:portal protein [Caulobacter segnis]